MNHSVIFIVISLLTSLGIVILSTPALIKIAYMKRLVDVPGDERKLHTRHIPTIGGVIIFAATIVSYLLWYPFTEISDFKYIAVTMIILFFIGIKDDLVGVSPSKKLLAHIIVAFILVIMAEIRLTSLHGLFGVRDIPFWLSVALSVFTYTVIVNAFNLIDGLDGLATGVGLIACFAFGIWFYFAGAYDDAILSFALAGALLGFLVFNFAPAKIFMGDSGSLTIGLIISILSIKLVEFPIVELKNQLMYVSKPIFAMAVLVYPLTDTLRIFVVRTLKGKSPFAADRNHLHHKLIDMGLTHAQCVGVIYGFSLLLITLAAFIRIDSTYLFVLLTFLVLLFAQIPPRWAKYLHKKKAGLTSNKIK